MAPKNPNKNAGNKRVTRQTAGSKGKGPFVEESDSKKSRKTILIDEVSESPPIETPTTETDRASDEVEKGVKRSLTFRSPTHKTRYDNSISKKRVIYEKPVDIPLFTQINILNMFNAIGLDAVLRPPNQVYPHLVREFYANLTVEDNQLLISQVKGTPFIANPEIFGRLLGVPFTGPNPYTRNTPVEEFENLPLTRQHEIICGKPQPDPDFKPILGDLTPISSLLQKVIHANIVPRNSSRDKVTYLDTILLACLQSETPFNMASLMIDHMGICVEHSTKSLPYAALLTKVFEHMRVIGLGELSFNLREYIDAEVLQASNLVVNEDGQLVWAKVPDTFTTTRMDPPLGKDSGSILTNLSLFQIEKTVKDNSMALEELKVKLAVCMKTMDELSEYTQSSYENLIGHLIKMESGLIRNRRMMGYEFASFQDGLVRIAKEWNTELLKLAANNSKELMFLSKQICGISKHSGEPFREWFSHAWFGEKSVEELTPKLAIPVLPPPDVFGMSRDEYVSKVSAWLAARDRVPTSEVNITDHFVVFDDLHEGDPSTAATKPKDEPNQDTPASSA